MISQNDGAWITGLLTLYKRNLESERNIQPLSDDYIKFWRLSQHLIADAAGTGIVALVTNHTFYSGVIHRSIRHSFLETFSRMFLVDLHGSSLLGLNGPDGSADANVFDIQQGVAISVLVRKGSGRINAAVFHRDVWGPRTDKYEYLSAATASGICEPLRPTAPFWLFCRTSDTPLEYHAGTSVEEVFRKRTTGFVTGRDESLVAFDEQTMRELLAALRDRHISDAVIASRFGIADTKGWPVARRRKALRAVSDPLALIRAIDYRPFDSRFTIYSDFLQRARRPVLEAVSVSNPALITSRLIKGETPAHVFIGKAPVEKIFLSPKTSNNAFVFPRSVTTGSGSLSGSQLECNLTLGVRRRVASILQESEEQVSEKTLQFVYALLFSAQYRERYSEELSRGFPRILWPRDRQLLAGLIRLGADLVALHLLEDDYRHTSWNQPGATNRNPLAHALTTFHDEGDCEVRKVGETGKKMAPSPKGEGFGRVYINETAYFDGVPEAVWNFRIGGYQVCHKWLYDRRRIGGKSPRPGRVLTDDDIRHYHRIVIALNETIRIMQEIDEVIEAHGGWPDAFVTQGQKASTE